MKNRLLKFFLPLFLLTQPGFAMLAHADLPAITGEHWTASERNSKLSFLMGIATMVKVEQNLLGDPPPPGTVSFAPALAKGLGGMTLTEIMKRIDVLYAEHPDRINEAVISMIWSDIVVPRLESQE